MATYQPQTTISQPGQQQALFYQPQQYQSALLQQTGLQPQQPAFIQQPTYIQQSQQQGMIHKQPQQYQQYQQPQLMQQQPPYQHKQSYQGGGGQYMNPHKKFEKFDRTQGKFQGRKFGGPRFVNPSDQDDQSPHMPLAQKRIKKDFQKIIPPRRGGGPGGKLNPMQRPSKFGGGQKPFKKPYHSQGQMYGQNDSPSDQGGDHSSYYQNTSPPESPYSHHSSKYEKNPSSLVQQALQVTKVPSKTFFKTKICPGYLKGDCKKGDKCQFAHSEEEVRSQPDLKKTKLCIQFQKTGQCDKGEICQYAHGENELKSTPDLFKTTLCTNWTQKGRCNHGIKCRYAHGEQELRSNTVLPEAIDPNDGFQPRFQLNQSNPYNEFDQYYMTNPSMQQQQQPPQQQLIQPPPFLQNTLLAQNISAGNSILSYPSNSFNQNPILQKPLQQLNGTNM